jgi:hypothetical protein
VTAKRRARDPRHRVDRTWHHRDGASGRHAGCVRQVPRYWPLSAGDRVRQGLDRASPESRTGRIGRCLAQGTTSVRMITRPNRDEPAATRSPRATAMAPESFIDDLKSGSTLRGENQGHEEGGRYLVVPTDALDQRHRGLHILDAAMLTNRACTHDQPRLACTCVMTIVDPKNFNDSIWADTRGYGDSHRWRHDDVAR